MCAARAESAGALRALEACAIATAGFREDALDRDALLRLLQQRLDEGATPQEVEEACRRADERLIAGLHRAVSVGETFFFRHPEQFAALLGGGVPAEGHSGKGLRAWSAGCATGEEAWSLAATLASIAPEDKPPSILGTDLLESSVASARTGAYRRWSLRPSAPLLHPLLDKRPDGTYSIRPQLRPLITFHRHNLLDEPPGRGDFDVVFCRNVLVYFTPEARQRALDNLIEATAPGGLLAFGPMDLPDPPKGLVPVGGPALQLFRRAAIGEQPRRRAGSTSGRISASSRASAPSRPSGASRASGASRTSGQVTGSAELQSRSGRRLPAPTAQTTGAGTSTSPVHVSSTSLAAGSGFANGRRLAPGTNLARAVQVHTNALIRLEQGDGRGAEEELRRLVSMSPDYIPGLVEIALLRARLNDIASARELMSQVLRLASGRSSEEVLEGPEPLPMRFYIASAEALLEQHDGTD